MEKIKVELGYANLTVEKCNGDYPNYELAVYLEDTKTGLAIQDIAIIRKALKGLDIECLIWTDQNDDDYTYKFNIKHDINAVER